MSRYSVAFAGARVTVDGREPASRSILDFLFRDFPPGRTEPVVAHMRLAGGADGRMELRRGDVQLYRGSSAGEAARTTLGEIFYWLAERGAVGPVWHAAAVARAGCGVLLPADSGAGKSTLAHWLDHAGWEYLGDELAHVPTGGRALYGLTRPLHRKGEVPPLPDGCEGSARLRTEDGWLIAARTPRRGVEPPRLEAIVFPKRELRQGAELHSLSKAQAGLRLMEHLVNARNLPRHGFEDVARLAERVSAVELRYDTAASAVEALDRAF